MARLLDRASLQNPSTSTSIETNNSLELSLNSAQPVPMIYNPHLTPNTEQTTASRVLTTLQSNIEPQASAAPSSLHDSSGLQAKTTSDNLAHVLANLQSTGDLSTLLQQQPNLLQELNSIAAGEVSSNLESLRYEGDIGQEPPSSRRLPGLSKPTVYKEQDRFLPIHNVARIMRNSIGKNGKISKEAKECVQECVSEFISFITSEASDKCLQEKRKTITGDDILFAMATLGFDNHIEPLRVYLQKYREYAKAEKAASPPRALASDTNNAPVAARTMTIEDLRPVIAAVPQPAATTEQLEASVNSVPVPVDVGAGSALGSTQLSVQRLQ